LTFDGGGENHFWSGLTFDGRRENHFFFVNKKKNPVNEKKLMLCAT
jgi:hypothetical protein